MVSCRSMPTTECFVKKNIEKNDIAAKRKRKTKSTYYAITYWQILQQQQQFIQVFPYLDMALPKLDIQMYKITSFSTIYLGNNLLYLNFIVLARPRLERYA